MSASRKKKAQNSLNAAKMTERQLQEQQEAKKLPEVYRVNDDNLVDVTVKSAAYRKRILV